MDLNSIVTDLRKEWDRIGRAIAALAGGKTTRGRRTRVAAPKAATRRKRGSITPAGRKRLSILMKKRWAERRAKKTSVKGAAAAKVGNRKKRGGLTAAGRKKLSQAMKMRWAERKKQAS